MGYMSKKMNGHNINNVVDGGLLVSIWSFQPHSKSILFLNENKALQN